VACFIGSLNAHAGFRDRTRKEINLSDRSASAMLRERAKLLA
jgi:hypothetical protein